ncbi:hypothetical protein HYU17_04930 [Candidatus Woesearchaeota archaeon]|nr:hypothetical protein [Candidatus Woesearchaeota archaeon]
MNLMENTKLLKLTMLAAFVLLASALFFVTNSEPASLAIAAAVPKQERAQIPRRAVVVVLAAVIPHEIAG